MKSFLSSVLLGIMLMTFAAEASGANAPHIEPGKQLPQSVKVRGGQDADSHETTIRYYLFVPKAYREQGEPWPLLMFLHGLGECSTYDLARAKIHGPASFVEKRPDFPFVLITPQSPPPINDPPGKEVKRTSEEIVALVRKAWNPEQLIQLVDHVEHHLQIDPNRVYVTGLSMGGFGTWRLAATYPDRFAAIAPICGGGQPADWAKPLSKVPIWAFHGAKDPVVPLASTQSMVDAIRAAGGNVQLTVYPDVQHNAWVPAYNDPKLYEWFLAHQRKHTSQSGKKVE
ncbi:MAG: prolyl oligopeptidase family serine peptidase [Pirellulales bacterium]|nr:prolyl oligopeptidase family serine peptidase [Pirellulales bacterium]